MWFGSGASVCSPGEVGRSTCECRWCSEETCRCNLGGRSRKLLNHVQQGIRQHSFPLYMGSTRAWYLCCESSGLWGPTSCKCLLITVLMFYGTFVTARKKFLPVRSIFPYLRPCILSYLLKSCRKSSSHELPLRVRPALRSAQVMRAMRAAVLQECEVWEDPAASVREAETLATGSLLTSDTHQASAACYF